MGNRRVSLHLKEQLYKIVIRLAMIYEVEWVVKKIGDNNVNVTWMTGSNCEIEMTALGII